MKNEQGRTIIETILVLVVIGLLSLAGILGYMMMSRQQKTEEILNTLKLKTVAINSAMAGKTFSDSEELNKFLAGYSTQVVGYKISFFASESGDGFASEITNITGEPIKGAMCRELITKMADQRFVSDVEFSVKDEEENKDVKVRLNGEVVDLDSVCGG